MTLHTWVVFGVGVFAGAWLGVIGMALLMIAADVEEEAYRGR